MIRQALVEVCNIVKEVKLQKADALST